MFVLKRLPDGQRLVVVFRPQDYPDAARIALGAVRVSLRRKWREAVQGRVAVLDLADASAPRSEVRRMIGTRRIVGRVTSVTQLERLVPVSAIAVCGWQRDDQVRQEELRDLAVVVEKHRSVRRVFFSDRRPWSFGQVAVDEVPPEKASRRESTSGAPLGVFVHIYYTELAEEVKSELSQIAHPKTVYISTDTQAKRERIVRTFPDAVVKVVPNAGRDIGAKLIAFREEHRRHEVVLHTHAKRSYTDGAGEGSRAWHAHNVACLLSSPQRVETILSWLQGQSSVSVVAPQPWGVVHLTANWSVNRALADVLTARWGWPELPSDSQLAFPVGSTFWAKTDALAPLLDADLTVADLGEEAGQRDGTVAHVLERLVGVSCALSGGKLYQVMPG